MPDKDAVIAMMRKDCYIEYDSMMGKLREVSENIILDYNLKRSDRVSVSWELIEQILNAKVEKMVKTYQSDHLTRLNGVNFRTTIAIKSEKKYASL